jgi:hypothetical protein
MSEEAQSDWKKRELGALWRREGKNQNFLSGKVTIGKIGEEQEVQIVVFKNNYKDNDKQPDFRIYEDKPRPPQDVEESAAVAPEKDNVASAPEKDNELPDILQ